MIAPLIAAAATVFLSYLAIESSGWGTFWFSVLAIGGVAETYALSKRAKGDTLSENVWRVTDAGWKKALLGVFMVWLSWHLVADGEDGAD